MLGMLFALAGCGVLRPSQVTESPLPPLCTKGEQHQRVVIFVHGLFGNARTSWLNMETRAYWPELLASDSRLSDFGVCVVEYDSPLLESSWRTTDIAAYFLMKLESEEFFTTDRELYFIAHSMGGVVVQRMLTMLNTPEKVEKLHRVRAALLVSTPSLGTPLSSLAALLSNNPQVRGLTPEQFNDALSALIHDWRTLRQERDVTRAFAPRAHCAHEEKETWSQLIVSRASAGAECDSVQGLPFNHIDIVKPRGRDSEAYSWAKSVLIASSTEAPGDDSTDRYILLSVVAGTMHAIFEIEDFTSRIRALSQRPRPVDDKRKQSDQDIYQALMNLRIARMFEHDVVRRLSSSAQLPASPTSEMDWKHVRHSVSAVMHDVRVLLEAIARGHGDLLKRMPEAYRGPRTADEVSRLESPLKWPPHTALGRLVEVYKQLMNRLSEADRLMGEYMAPHEE